MKKELPAITGSPYHAVLLASTSISVLAYEIVLIRLLSIGQWHHFAYMVISMALLGFGAAGSLLFILFDRIRRNVDYCLVFLAGATAISFSFAFSLSQQIGLDPLQLIWQPSQWPRMLATYLLMAVPFLLAGGIVGIILTGAGDRIHRMYGVDLLSAGCGALAIVPALYIGAPWRLLPLLGFLIILGAIWGCLRMKFRIAGAVTLLVAGAVLVTVHILLPPLPRIHNTKGLPMTLAFPDARIEAEDAGPLGEIHVVGSRLIRHVPGLSLNFGLEAKDRDATIPEQKAIFVDADGLSPITHFTGDSAGLEHLDFTSTALPFHIRHPEKMLVVGAGGGTDILMGILHHVPEITALEANQQIAELLERPFAGFSGNLYSRPDVRLELREARQFLHSSDKRFDLIQISMIDSFVNSAGGLHSATESYLYTVEAFRQCLAHLSDTGMLAVTRWLKLPPRDSLRTISIALKALGSMNLSPHPEEHLLFIRSWKTFTIVLSRSRFSRDEILKAQEFCEDRGFDIAYHAWMKADQANRYDIQETPCYYDGAKALCGPDAERFLRDYIFDVSATIDDRPFFSHFFQWQKAVPLFRQLQKEWLPIIEMGYFFILATLVQAILAVVLFILLPLVFLRRAEGQPGRTGPSPRLADIAGSVIYFGSIGAGFMFLEMAIIPRYTLLLSHPVYAASVVLATVLVFAGCGSLCVGRFRAVSSWFLWIVPAVILFWVIVHNAAGDNIFYRILGLPFPHRLAFAIILLAPLSFFLGWPFPAGLRALAEKFPGLAPWAWGINGCASVIGAVLGKCLAVGIGFRSLMFTACAMYLVAVATFYISFHSTDIETYS